MLNTPHGVFLLDLNTIRRYIDKWDIALHPLLKELMVLQLNVRDM